VRGAIRIYLEVGSTRTFAVAVDWPGWSRSGRTEELATEALRAYAERYGSVVRLAHLDPPRARDRAWFEVVQRLRGNATTDFGAPGVPPDADADPLPPAELRRQLTLLRASWKGLDAAARRAHGVELRKGPRGGGRDLDKILDHVLGAEEGYLRALGGSPPPRGDDMARDTRRERAAVIRDVASAARGGLPPGRRKTRWTARYFIRRAAWHVLDHAWEIADRSDTRG